jgi:hypothetical protein
MARVTADSKTGLSGKMEGVVYVNLNGQTYTRRAPRFKKDSVTPGMRLNQQRFKKANEFCSLFKDSLIPQIWNGIDQSMSGYSLFLKSNMPAFAADGSILDVKRIRLSMGKLSFPTGFEAHRSHTDESLIVVSWPKELNVGGVHLKDQLMAISCVDGQYSDIISTGIERNDLGGTFALPDIPMPQAPGSLPLYLFFASANRREYSKSECFEV